MPNTISALGDVVDNVEAFAAINGDLTPIKQLSTQAGQAATLRTAKHAPSDSPTSRAGMSGLFTLDEYQFS